MTQKVSVFQIHHQRAPPFSSACVVHCSATRLGINKRQRVSEKTNLFNCIFHNISNNDNLLRLTYALCSCHRLKLYERIPLWLENIYMSCYSKIQTEHKIKGLAIKFAKGKSTQPTLLRLYPASSAECWVQFEIWNLQELWAFCSRSGRHVWNHSAYCTISKAVLRSPTSSSRMRRQYYSKC